MFTRGVLGINKRNTYIREFNPEKGIRLAKNKHKTKSFLSQRSIPVPATLAHIIARHIWLEFDLSTITANSFVIKPNKGSKGEGIIIVTKRKKDEKGEQFLVHGTWISSEDLKERAATIFDGGLGLSPDTILIEERLVAGEGFDIFCEFGLADIRVIVCNLVPIIAMLRMPTLASQGKANLAQGGIGLGVHIVTGKIISLYREGTSYTDQFPIQWSHLKNKKIPYRQEIIQYTANTQYFVNSGYLGLDRVITANGPKLLEINARAGLEIQNITGQGLLHIIQKVEDLDITTPQKGIEVSKSLFSDEHIYDMDDKLVLYLSQTGKLSYMRGTSKKHIPLTITVDLKKNKTYISPKLHHFLRSTSSRKLIIGDHVISLKNVELLESPGLIGNKIVLGKSLIRDYHIKPIHKSNVITSIFQPGVIVADEVIHLKVLDEELHKLNKHLNLARILHPINYLDEFDAFVSSQGDYNPQFKYNFPKYVELNQWLRILQALDLKYRQKEYFDSLFAQVFYDKIDKMMTKIALIKAYKKQDFRLIDRYNKELFGEIEDELVLTSENMIQQGLHIPHKHLGAVVQGKKIIEYITNYLYDNHIHGVRIKTHDTGLSRLSVGFGRYATIKLRNNISIREYKLLSQLIHEIDVHIQRYQSGQKTGWHILSTGVGGYLSTEEGLAVYLSDTMLAQRLGTYDSLAKYKNYYRSHQATQTDFITLSKIIHSTYNKKTNTIKNYKVLFNRTLKFVKGKKDTSLISNGIVFGKNIVYLNGYQQIKKLAVQDQQAIKKLLKYGKIRIEDLKYFR